MQVEFDLQRLFLVPMLQDFFTTVNRAGFFFLRNAFFFSVNSSLSVAINKKKGKV